MLKAAVNRRSPNASRLPAVKIIMPFCHEAKLSVFSPLTLTLFSVRGKLVL
jgi:hypothetical protein